MNTHPSHNGSRFASALSRSGFTLIEVVLGSVVLASFMAGSIYMAGEVAQSRIQTMQDRDLNSWANVQAQMASEGIDATKTNSVVWDDKNFASLSGGSLDANTYSALVNGSGHDPALRSVRIQPFRVNLTGVAQRENDYTLGFRILDTETSTGTAVTLTKETDSGTGTAAILVYDHITHTYRAEAAPSDGGTLELDAWKDFEWDANGPIIYLLANSDEQVAFNTDGPSDTAMSSGLPAGAPSGISYNYYARLDNTAFGGNDADVHYLASAGGAEATFNLKVNPVTPVIVTEVLNLDGSVRYSSRKSDGTPDPASLKVTLADVLPGVVTVTPEDRALMETGRLHISLYGDDPYTSDNLMPAALYSLITTTTTIGSSYIGIAPDVATPGYTFDAPATAFGAPDTAQNWKTTVIPKSGSTVAANFISSTTQNDSITAVATKLPKIDIIKTGTSEVVNGSTPRPIYASQSITLEPATTITLDPLGTIKVGWNTDDFTYSLYEIRYLYSDTGGTVGLTSSLYTTPFVIGTDMTYSTTAEVDAKALSLYSDLYAFLVEEVDQDYALFVKNLSSGNAYVWNYAGPYSSDSSLFTTRIRWSNVDSAQTVKKYSWEGLKAPGTAAEIATGREQNALFQSAIPYNASATSSRPNHTVQVDNTTAATSYTLNGLFFDYKPDASDTTASTGFTIAKRDSSSTVQYLTFKNDASLYTELSTLSNDTGKAHTITAPIKIMQPLIVNTTNSASNVSVSDVYNNATSSSTSSDGVIKQGAGTLILNTASTANSDSYGHKVRFVLDGGTLQFAGNNAVNGYPDDGGQAGVILNGGRWNMNGYDQDFYNSGGYNGILTVTNHSELSFGANVSSTKNTPSLLWVSSVEISGGQLNVYNYAMKDGSTVRPNASSASTSPLWTSKWDTFYSAYPGLPVLGNIVFKDLTQFWSATNTKKITGRWRVISGTYGEIIPRRPPKSSGIAYLSVSNNSRIFFEGTSKLSVEDISIYNGVLEIRNWSAGDNLFVAPNKDGDTQDVTTYDVYLNCYYLNGAAKSKSKAIRFYNDAGQFVGYGNLVGPIDVTRTDIETGKVVTNYNVYRVTPKL